MAREVTVVDAGLGNLASVERALVQVGAGVRVTSDPDKVATARMVVFPGQSAFGAATRAVLEGSMGAALRMVIERGDPFLGICLGMQLLFDGSDENGGQEGLGVLPGWCRRFPVDQTFEAEPGAREREAMPADPTPDRGEGIMPPGSDAAADEEQDARTRIVAGAGGITADSSDGDDDSIVEPEPADAVQAAPEPEVAAPVQSVIAPPAAVVDVADAEDAVVTPLRRRLKVPHAGWNEVEPTGEHYYFVHSYYVEAARPEDVMWMARYGDIRFAAAVRRNNVLGCQFHPEKSQRAGLKFLRAFLLGGWG